MSRLAEVELNTRESSCKIFLGEGTRSLIRNYTRNYDHVGIISQINIPDHGMRNLFGASNFLVEDSEWSKSLTVVEKISLEMISKGFSRNSLLIGLGGGVVSDLTGFIASIYMRGIDYINVPTTLTGQVDAAIGGKTAVNLMTGHKNILGTFKQPVAILVDPIYLESLSPQAMLSGFGEIAKYVLIGALGIEDDNLMSLIEKCVRFKAEIVEKDEKETSKIRSILNYGHTLGHAIEACSKDKGLRISHGEAVAIGLRYAGELAFRLGLIGSDMLKYHYDVLSHFNLPIKVPQALEPNELIDFIKSDKKKFDKSPNLTFVLLDKNTPKVFEDINKNTALEVLKMLY